VTGSADGRLPNNHPRCPLLAGTDEFTVGTLNGRYGAASSSL
jgi:hypothetical protein